MSTVDYRLLDRFVRSQRLNMDAPPGSGTARRRLHAASVLFVLGGAELAWITALAWALGRIA